MTPNELTYDTILDALQGGYTLQCNGGTPHSEDYDEGEIGEDGTDLEDVGDHLRLSGGVWEVLVSWEGAATTDWTPIEGLRESHPGLWGGE